MRGHFLEQLEAKNENLGNYNGCLTCQFHWHRRSFEKHLNVAQGAERQDRPVAIIHPAIGRFMNILVDGAITT